MFTWKDNISEVFTIDVILLELFSEKFTNSQIVMKFGEACKTSL